MFVTEWKQPSSPRARHARRLVQRPYFRKIRLVKLANWSTSPRAYHARWSVQSPACQLSELVDQSPSVSCSVVGTVPSLSIVRTGRPVPERIVLGGRYSPQFVDWANWSVQSPSISCLSNQRSCLSFEKMYRRINVQCDGASCHIVSLLRKKGRVLTVQPLFARTKKRKPAIIQKGHQINCDNS